jgi:hypothetical protein
MKLKIFHASLDEIDKEVNAWLASDKGPAQIVAVSQSESPSDSGEIEVVMSFIYKPRSE